ncbi:SDR family NAD(P)-dependent oxidoreductase [Marinicellulosiphila megalodicopiae]|uniref:SDR family NAD(P)-dependent oxidoreductase n=1 Tax=Marinicellulosiphila megalodicopiae TaxID=2724896 RepID=UPI003BAE3AFD
MFNLKGKSVLVTGANRGIGLGFIEALLANGASTIYAAGRDKNALEEVVALNPEIIKAIKLDVLDDSDIQSLTQKIESLDVLINNAGIANGCFNTAPNAVEIAKLEMDTHYFGPLKIIHQCLPLLKQSKQAFIINIASIAALSNFPSLGPYSATKAALMSLTQGLRIELAGDNIKAVCVYPGPTDTRLAPGEQMPKATRQSVAINTFEGINQGQLDIYPDDFAKAMFTLLEEHPNKLAQTFKEFHI